MNGRGYRIGRIQYNFRFRRPFFDRKCQLFILIFVGLMLIYLFIRELVQLKREPVPSTDAMNDIYGNTPDVIHECTKEYLNSAMLNISAIRNGDEVKYAITPVDGIQEDEECNIITLGIGYDVIAEAKLRPMFPQKCRFSGADPTMEKNKELFESIGGTYFQRVISAQSGKGFARVYRGWLYQEEEPVSQTDIVTFLKNDVKINRVVDLLLMDIEMKERVWLPLIQLDERSHIINAHRGYGWIPVRSLYELPMIVRISDGRLDNNNITICQYNIEFHWPYGESLKRFGIFVLDTLQDGRYTLLKSFYRQWRDHHLVSYHVMRLYALNTHDPICISRYLSKKQQ